MSIDTWNSSEIREGKSPAGPWVLLESHIRAMQASIRTVNAEHTMPPSPLQIEVGAQAIYSVFASEADAPADLPSWVDCIAATDAESVENVTLLRTLAKAVLVAAGSTSNPTKEEHDMTTEKRGTTDKKPYTPPTLTNFGSIKNVTGGSGPPVCPDGSPRPPTGDCGKGRGGPG